MSVVRPVVFMGLMTLVLFSSCSGSDDETSPAVVEPTGNPIVFSGGLKEQQEVSTRAATGLHDAGVGTFRVWAYKNDAVSNGSYTSYQTVINGYSAWWEPAASTSNTNSWEYVNGSNQTIKYWDLSAKAYRFGALAPSTASHTATISGTDTKTLDVTFMADASDAQHETNTPYYSELWFSDNVNYPDRRYRQPVQMQFKKPFAYVRFIFTFEDPDDKPITYISNKSFKPFDGGLIENKGEVTVSYPLTGTATVESFAVTDNTPSGLSALTQDYYDALDTYLNASEGSAPEKYWYTVLPAVNQGTYTLNVSINDEPKNTTVPAAYMDWLPGYRYTYIFKIHKDGSVSIDNVQSAFTPWVVETGNHAVYNW